MMLKLLAVPLLVFCLGWALEPAPALAQGASRDIADSLSRLKNNPRYKGRVLGTHLQRNNGETLYEVRILRKRDDRVILVYIDPETGGVVGDSERSVRPQRTNPQRANPDRERNNRRWDRPKNRRPPPRGNRDRRNRR